MNFSILTQLPALQAFRTSRTGTVALVPTMGALHEGHIALVTQARKMADTVIASIFVNPAQFAPHEDLASYPRTFEEDCKMLSAAGCDAVWAPEVNLMYPQGQVRTLIQVGQVSAPLEGEFRPQFFSGVATIVAKLFHQVNPHIALFGEKDWQQLQVIKAMAHDLNFPIEIIGIPTVRDENGLALSSRNKYLSADQYQIAIQLNKILASMVRDLGRGEDTENIEANAHAALLYAGFDKVDYCTIRDAETLMQPQGRQNRILAAAWCGKARLIDNIPV